jgi:endoglucanase
MFKECDSSPQKSSEKSPYQAIAQEAWNGNQARCGKSAETASEHLPCLSIGDDGEGFFFKDSLSRADRSSDESTKSCHKERTTDGGMNEPMDGRGINLPDSGAIADPGHAMPRTSISELTEFSEQLLPVHHNGSYPSVADWESLHSANVERADEAARNGSELLFFGDSITEAMGYDPAAIQPFKNNFGADNPTALGLGGDGTQQLLYRLNHGEMQGTPKAVVINIGTNDIGSLTGQQIADNVQKSIESIQLRSPGTRIVLTGILPRTESGDPGNYSVDETNRALSKLATADGAVQFVDLKNAFVDGDGNQRPELYKADKLHLSSAGYQAWAEGIKNAIYRIDNMPALPAVPDSGSGSGTASDHSGSSNAGGNSGFGDSGYWGNPSAPGNSGTWDGGNPGSYESGNSGSNNTGSGTWGGDSGSGTGYAGSDSGDNVYDKPGPNDNVGSPLTTLDTANIRGVNLSGAEWGKNSSTDTQFWPTEEELDYYKSKGMNTVRLMLSWEQLQPKLGGPLDTAEINRLKDFLREADERGIKVLVTGGSFARYTLNHGPFGAGADGQVNGTRVGADGVPVAAMADFWTRMVNEINSDPVASRAVGGWDLTNEPHTMGGTWPAIATAVDKAIRATGDQHTIVVEGDQWARDFSGLEELARIDKNVAFEAHSYWDDGSGGYANQNPPANVNVGVDHIRPFVQWLQQNNAKGFVGEWGVPTNNLAWAPAVTNFIDYLDANNIGNMVWAGGPGWQDGYKLSVEPINGQDRAIMKTIIDANET